jgi:hypothetical protein
VADVVVTAYEADLQADIAQAAAAPFNIQVSTVNTLYGQPLPTAGEFYVAVANGGVGEVFKVTRVGAPAGQLRALVRAVSGPALAHDADDVLVEVRSVYSTDAVPDDKLASPADLNVLDARLDALEAAAWTTVKLAADISQTTTTLADVPGLALPVLANRHYEFQFLLVYTTQAATTGAAFALTGPAKTWVAHRVETPSTTTASILRHANDYNQEAQGANLPTAGGFFLATVDGLARPTAGGNLTPRYRSEVAGSSVTVKAGSIGKIREV